MLAWPADRTKRSRFGQAGSRRRVAQVLRPQRVGHRGHAHRARPDARSWPAARRRWTGCGWCRRQAARAGRWAGSSLSPGARDARAQTAGADGAAGSAARSAARGHRTARPCRARSPPASDAGRGRERTRAAAPVRGVCSGHAHPPGAKSHLRPAPRVGRPGRSGRRRARRPRGRRGPRPGPGPEARHGRHGPGDAAPGRIRRQHGTLARPARSPVHAGVRDRAGCRRAARWSPR